MFPGDIERDHCQEMGKHNFWSQEIKMLRGLVMYSQSNLNLYFIGKN